MRINKLQYNATSNRNQRRLLYEKMNTIRLTPLLKYHKHLFDQNNISFIEALFFSPLHQRLSDKQGALQYQLKENNYELFNLFFDYVMQMSKQDNKFTYDKLFINAQILSYTLSKNKLTISDKVYNCVLRIFKREYIPYSYKVAYMMHLIKQAGVFNQIKFFNRAIKDLRDYYWQCDQSSMLCL